MEKKQDIKLGIISGAGPEAGAFLYSQMIKECQKLGAWQDADFPTIHLYSFPFADMLSAEIDAGLLRSQVAHCLDELLKLGCQRIVLACQTAHLFLPEELPEEFVHLVQVVKSCLSPVSRNLAVVASLTSCRQALHSQLLQQDCEYLEPERSDATIATILRGEKPDLEWIEQVAAKRPVLLGCTEYSTVFAENSNPYIIDPLRLVAQQLIKEIYL